MTNIKVTLREDRMGNLIATPVRNDIRHAIRKYLYTWNVRTNGELFFQQGMGAEEAARFTFGLTDAQIKDLAQGWDVTVIYNSYDLLAQVGYDAHNAIEVTSRKAIVRSY